MNDKPTTVALWGPPSAGKTMLLAALYLQRQHHAGDWQVWPTTESEAFTNFMRDVIQINGLFPPATQKATSESVFYRFHNKETHREAALLVDDRAGAEIMELGQEIRRALAEADALMLLFDPLRSVNAFLAEVDRTFDAIHTAAGRGVAQDPRPVAICLSKADELIRSSQQLDDARKDPDVFARRCLRERGAETVLSRLDQFCSRYRLFPVTSVGIRRQWGAIEPVVYYDEGLQARIGRQNEALSLLQPFEWLFEQVESP